MDPRIIPIVALAAMVGTMGLTQQVSADTGMQKVWMTITNTKTDTVKVVEWESQRYLFEKNIPFDVDDIKEKKIKRIFGTNKFTFTWQMNSYDSSWYHFNVSIEMKPTPGTTMRVVFI